MLKTNNVLLKKTKGMFSHLDEVVFLFLRESQLFICPKLNCDTC